MANTAEDATITAMFRELEDLKQSGKASSEPTSEYMRKLYQLRDATSNRVGFRIVEASRNPAAKQRTRDRHAARSLKYSTL